jgi:hypothetical protein
VRQVSSIDVKIFQYAEKDFRQCTNFRESVQSALRVGEYNGSFVEIGMNAFRVNDSWWFFPPIINLANNDTGESSRPRRRASFPPH